METSLHLRWFSRLQIWSVRRERQKSIYSTANRTPAFQSVTIHSINGMIICCDFDAHVPVWQLAGSWREGGPCVVYGGSVGFWKVDRTQRVSASVDWIMDLETTRYNTFYIQWNHYKKFYVWVSVHHKSILYKESTRCNFGSIVYY